MDEISRTKLTRLLESRMSYGDAQSADGLISGALAALEALMKYGVHLVLAPLDAQLEPDLAAILEGAHPSNRPGQEYPKWVYHDSKPAVLLDSEHEVDGLPPGYRDALGNAVSPVAVDAAPEPASIAEENLDSAPEITPEPVGVPVTGSADAPVIPAT